MFATVEETAAILGVSTKWVRERLDAGDASISRHLKCRRDEIPAKQTDRSPVRIATADLARYITTNTRAHGWADFSSETTDTSSLQDLERRIWGYLHWYRHQTD